MCKLLVGRLRGGLTIIFEDIRGNTGCVQSLTIYTSTDLLNLSGMCRFQNDKKNQFVK